MEPCGTLMFVKVILDKNVSLNKIKRKKVWVYLGGYKYICLVNKFWHMWYER